jgi:hypothetical protein
MERKTKGERPVAVLEEPPVELGAGLRARLVEERERRDEIGFDGLISPELVLVSPSELAALAREQLPAYPPPWARPNVPPARPVVYDQWAGVELAGFVGFSLLCALATLGPFFLILLAR